MKFFFNFFKNHPAILQIVLKSFIQLPILVMVALLCAACNVNKNVEIYFVDEDGNSYIDNALEGQAFIMFKDGVPEQTQHEIIDACGGVIMENFPLLDCYLVEVSTGKELDFIRLARDYNEVEDARLNSISDSMGFEAHVIDKFNDTTINDTKNNVCMSHGEYALYAAHTAYPESPDGIIDMRYNLDDFRSFFNSPLSQRNINKYLCQIFENANSDALLLINLSIGRDIGSRKRQLWDESTSEEQNNWVNSNIDQIRFLARSLRKLYKINPNFILFKSAGNEGCHVMDEVIFNNLGQKLSPEQLYIVQNHILFVGAKDDDFNNIEELPVDHTKLYAYYTNSPAIYCPYMTLVDITHLSEPGTSFAAPYLLGKVAKLFDTKGYRPLDKKNSNGGYTVYQMMRHIKDSTRKYANSVQQPGLYTDNAEDKTYFYDNTYTFRGVIKSDYEDLCETGKPEKFYYIEVNPISIQPKEYSELDESLHNVTRLQIFSDNLQSYVGKEASVTGELMYHIAGCHIHTDAYLQNISHITASAFDR